jgi:predicted nucleotidyltransferase
MADILQVEAVLAKVAGWAAGQPDLLAVGLVGSYARGQAHETSDVDLILIAEDPARLLEQRGWVEGFGTVSRVRVEDYGLVTSLRAWYLDGLEVEFGFTGRAWASQPLDPGTRWVIEGELRVLYERDKILSPLVSAKSAESRPS